MDAISGEACPLKSAQDLALLLENDDPDSMPGINAHAANQRRKHKLVRHESMAVIKPSAKQIAKVTSRIDADQVASCPKCTGSALRTVTDRQPLLVGNVDRC